MRSEKTDDQWRRDHIMMAIYIYLLAGGALVEHACMYYAMDW